MKPVFRQIFKTIFYKFYLFIPTFKILTEENPSISV